MKYTGTIAGELSGSLGGIVASRNRGGAYLRQKVAPVNPNTARQAGIKTIVADLTNRWLATLSSAQRAAWDLYAEQVGASPPPAGLGINIGGIAAYVRGNLPRLYSDWWLSSSLGRVDDAPIAFNLGSFSPVTALFTAPNDVQLTFDNTDLWANEVNGFMLCFCSPPQNPSVNNYTGRYHLVNMILGDPIPPAVPDFFVSDFPFATGNRVFMQVRSGRADGRYSSAMRIFGNAV